MRVNDIDIEFRHEYMINPHPQIAQIFWVYAGEKDVSYSFIAGLNIHKKKFKSFALKIIPMS